MTEDALVQNPSNDLYAGLVGDLTEDLIEAGVVGDDRKDAVGQRDLSALWLLLGWSERRGGSERRCRRGGGGCGREGRYRRDRGRRFRLLGGYLRPQQRGGGEADGGNETYWPGALHAIVGRSIALECHRSRRQAIAHQVIAEEPRSHSLDKSQLADLDFGALC